MAEAKPAAEQLTKADTVALWHAVNNMAFMVSELPKIEGVTPEQIELERERLRAAKRALRKVNTLRNALLKETARRTVLD